LVLGAGQCAYADTVTYGNLLKQAARQRQTARRHLLLRVADRRRHERRADLGAYKRCMLSRGSRYSFIRRERVVPEHSWIDPDTG
jgi:hypothetical protein